jgi:hypothetical protein
MGCRKPGKAPEWFIELKCKTTNFAFQLISLFPIVEINILMRSIAMGVGDLLWNNQFG